MKKLIIGILAITLISCSNGDTPVPKSYSEQDVIDSLKKDGGMHLEKTQIEENQITLLFKYDSLKKVYICRYNSFGDFPSLYINLTVEATWSWKQFGFGSFKSDYVLSSKNNGIVKAEISNLILGSCPNITNYKYAITQSSGTRSEEITAESSTKTALKSLTKFANDYCIKIDTSLSIW